MTERIIKTWTPILETLKVSEKNYDFFATYAEKFKEILTTEDNEQNLLPVNMKVLSLLDFDNIDITLSETPHVDVFEIKETIDKNVLPNTDGAFELKIIQDTESSLLNQLVTLLNSKKEISIYKLVNSIGIRNIDENIIEMFLTSRIKMN